MPLIPFLNHFSKRQNQPRLLRHNPSGPRTWNKLKLIGCETVQYGNVMTSQWYHNPAEKKTSTTLLSTQVSLSKIDNKPLFSKGVIRHRRFHKTVLLMK